MNIKLIFGATAIALLTGCANTTVTRTDPTYAEAAANRFVATNHEAVDKLVAGFNLAAAGDNPVLVATIVNVNDMRRSAPLGRTLSEQYASHLVNAGFNVKELKLRGDVFVKEQTGELLLSREIKDIAQSHHANYVLVGTYSVAASVTYVSLKFVRTQDSRIMRGHDYALPNDKDVNRLLQTTPNQ